MTREDGRWRQPALERFGQRLREVERAQTRTAGHQPRRRPAPARAGAVLAGAVLALLAVVLVVVPAGAHSPVNHAPAAARQSGSVRFDSSLRVSLNGRALTHFAEAGELNFVTGDYATTLSLAGERFDRRRVGGTFYGRQQHAHERPASERWHAVHVEQEPDGFDRVPGGYTLIDPQVVFRVLADSHSAVTLVGHQQLAGARTTHYRLSTTLAAFLSAEGSPVGEPARYETVLATVDVWLDARDRPRQVQASFAGAARLGTATMTSVIHFADYGEPVTVRPPSASEVSRRRAASTALLGDPLRAVELLLFAGR
jgi:hypothetical protein